MQPPPAPWSLAPAPEPLAPLREAAAEALRARPWPSPKDEAWRRSPLRELREAVERAAARPEPLPQPAAPIPDAHPLLPGQAPPPEALPEGLELLTLREAAARHPELLGRMGEALPPGRFPLADANTAGFEEGWLLRLAPGARPAEPLRLSLPWAGPALQRPRLLVHLGEGARLDLLVEHPEGPDGAVRLEATETLLERGAQLRQLLVLRPGPARAVAHLGVALRREAEHELLALLLGGAHGRLELSQRLLGEGARGAAAAVLLAEGREAAEAHLRAEHLAPSGSSTQRVRAAAAGRGRAVADARVAVRREAPGCEAEQRLDGLLLERGARVYCRPELTIEIDEVVARHGATVGALDEAALHWLRCRGIGRAQAEAMLQDAFLAAPLPGFGSEPLREAAVAALEQRLGRPLPVRPRPERPEDEEERP